MPDTWTRRRTWPNELDPRTGDLKEDWEILRDGRPVGRIYFKPGGVMGSTGMSAGVWFWAINRLFRIGAARTGQARAFDEAKKELLEAWHEIVMAHGIAIVENALKRPSERRK